MMHCVAGTQQFPSNRTTKYDPTQAGSNHGSVWCLPLPLLLCLPSSSMKNQEQKHPYLLQKKKIEKRSEKGENISGREKTKR